MLTFNNIFDTIYRYALGYIFSVIIGHLVIRLIVKRLWQSVDRTEYQATNWVVLSNIQGMVERFMYTISFQLGNPEFIGIWLILKVASQWEKWRNKPGYNAYLIGTGLSLIYGVCGALIISWYEQNDIKLYVVPPALLVVSLILFIWVYYKTKEFIKE